MRRVLVGLVAVLVGAGGLTAAGREDVSPVGEPKVQADTFRKFYVWCDAKLTSWNIRTTSKGKGGDDGFHKFAGTITLTDGKFQSVAAVGQEGQKGNGKAKAADFWEIMDGGKTLKFELNTKKALDGLDFVITPSTTEIYFDLTIDGKPQGKQIKFGKDARPLNTSKVFFKLR